MIFKRGYSLFEVLVVLGMVIILLGVVLVRLDTSRERARDNKQIARIQQLTLALQDYMAACHAYPDELDAGANNTRGGGTCSTDLGTILGNYEVNLSDFSYVPLRSNSTYCDGFHVSIRLEGNHPQLENDDDFDLSGSGVWTECAGSAIAFSDNDRYFDIKRP